MVRPKPERGTLYHVSKEAIKVCFITPFPPLKHGEAEYAWNYLKALIKLRSQTKFRFSVLSPTEEGKRLKDRIPTSAGSAVEQVTVKGVFRFGSNLERQLSSIMFLREILSIRPDLVHLSYAPNPEYGGRLGEPLLIMFLVLKLLGIPIIVTLHNVWLPDDIKNRAIELGLGKTSSSLAVSYFGFFMRIFTRLVDKVLVCSSLERSSMISEFIDAYKLDKEKIEEEPHGAEFSVVSGRDVEVAKEELGLKNRQIVLTQGFIREDKNIGDLIRAFSRISRDFERSVLLISGFAETASEKNYLSSLERLVTDEGLGGRVIFDKRYLSSEEMDRYVKAADVVVLPYTRNVGPSGPLHHAISRGKLVIASRVGYFKTLDGIIKLVPPNDRLALEKSLAESLTLRDPIMMKRLSEYGAMHDWSRVVTQNAEKYNSLVQRRTLPQN